MAVAMEVAWRSAELGSSSVPVMDLGKKRAWGADTEKLMQLMMGQFGGGGASASSSSLVKPAEVTLDLLGTGGSSSSCRAGTELDCNSAPEFLELEPDQALPSGWEKCLDLKTGELYFVNKSTGMRASEDPRKQLQQQQHPSPLVASEHEFLASKRSETESLQRASASPASSGGSPAPHQQQRLSFSTGKQLWSLQLHDRSTVSLNKTAAAPSSFPNSEEDSDLELNLNLSTTAGATSSPSRHQSVCTMEMVEKALKRTEKAMGKREMLGPRVSGSSSFSSLASSRSEPSWSQSSPSTSSSSSTSRSGAHNTSAATTAATARLDDSQPLKPGVYEAESRKAEATPPPPPPSDALVMGACTRCLTYVMLHKSDPKCPRCASEVPCDSFISPPSSKRQRLEATPIQT